LDIQSIIVGGSSAAGAASLSLWAFKMWVNSVNRKISILDDRLDKMAVSLHSIDRQLAKSDGEKSAKEELVWREINTDKIKIVKMTGQMEKLWRIIPIMASKLGIKTERTSDSIENLINDSLSEGDK